MLQKRIADQRLLAVILLALLLTACIPFAAARSEPPLTEGQTLMQLHLEPDRGRMAGAWIPYFTAARLLASDDEAVCREAVRNYLAELKALGINTVFLHVCAFGESIYPSAYYPAAPEANGHDGMQIFSDICAELGLSLHAWINPLRLQTDEYMQEHTDGTLLTRWFLDSELRAKYLSEWDGRWYLNPASDQTPEFLAGVAAELIAYYRPDGIHIDDYFYPTTETAWDSKDFAASGAADLTAWRTENISRIVKRMYGAVHGADSQLIFSVSPQGNFQANQESMFADVKTWLSEPGYADLLIPQIYYGYDNETAPFSDTLRTWVNLPRDESVQLAVGLAAYKVDAEDDFAGTGKYEWLTQKDVLSSQTADVLAFPDLHGVSYYHADALLSLPQSETERITASLTAE